MNTQAPVFRCIRLNTDPVANPASQVVCGQAHFTVLTARLIRLEWSATGEFEDRATFAFTNRAAETPPFTVTENSGTRRTLNEAPRPVSSRPRPDFTERVGAP